MTFLINSTVYSILIVLFRLDAALSSAGFFPNKIITTSWDPGFTCKPPRFNSTLADDVTSDLDRTIVAYCNWHSKSNMSVVLIGQNVGGKNTVIE